jgi:hypothetical protein
MRAEWARRRQRRGEHGVIGIIAAGGNENVFNVRPPQCASDAAALKLAPAAFHHPPPSAANNITVS